MVVGIIKIYWRSPSKHTWTLFVLLAGKHPRFKLDNV